MEDGSELSIVAQRLREARARAGISQAQLGIKAGMEAASAGPRINQYERGKHEPDLSTLTRLAAVLNVPVPYFYCDDSDLAEVIVGFSKLRKGERKRILSLLQGE